MISRLPEKYDVKKYQESFQVYTEIKESIDLPNFEYRVVFGGSCAKFTSLDYKELDIFIELSNPDRWNQFNDLLFSKLSKFPYIFKYSKHKYITIFYKNKMIDIVPCLKYTSKHPKDMDRSILHVDYVIENLKNSKYVRILKEVLKQNKIYGAETHISGVSGYTCQVIGIKYNPKILEFPKFKNIMDPTDQDRNILACTNPKNVFKFKEIIYNLNNTNFRKLNFQNFLDGFSKGLKLLVCTTDIPKDKILKNLTRLKKFWNSNNLNINFEIFFQPYYLIIIETVYINYINYRTIKGPSIERAEDIIKFTNRHNCYWRDSGISYDKFVNIDIISNLESCGIFIVNLINYLNSHKFEKIIRYYYNNKYGPL